MKFFIFITIFISIFYNIGFSQNTIKVYSPIDIIVLVNEPLPIYWESMGVDNYTLIISDSNNYPVLQLKTSDTIIYINNSEIFTNSKTFLQIICIKKGVKYKSKIFTLSTCYNNELYWKLNLFKNDMLDMKYPIDYNIVGVLLNEYGLYNYALDSYNTSLKLEPNVLFYKKELEKYINKYK